MSFILTLVASDKSLSAGHLAGIERFCDLNGLGQQGNPVWQKPHKAADLLITQKPDGAQIRELRTALMSDKVDLFVTSAAARQAGPKKLLIADMDATMVAGETLDEIAAQAGIGDHVAAITQRAMRGELDFEAALNERVGLLTGQPAALLDQVLAAMTLNDGARHLVQTMKKAGAVCILVSGGFTFFTGAVAELCGFDYHHGNSLELAGTQLTGKVIPPILDKNAKLKFLNHYVQQAGLNLADAVAIGDGANDLPMLEAAGLGIGFHPKPLVEQALDNNIIHGDLTAALYAQGLMPVTD